MHPTEDILDIFMAGIASVQPDILLKESISCLNDDILIHGKARHPKKVVVLGIGKAAAFMAKAAEDVLSERISSGCVITKYGFGCALKKIKVFEAGHPEPDVNSFVASEYLLKEIQALSANDLVIFLVSGGGSALCCDCPPGLQRASIIHTNHLLVRCGANIDEINKVRKHLSRLKGGQLLRLSTDAEIDTLGGLRF